MLCSACLQEWTANGHGLHGCLEWARWSPWSPLPWQFPDNMRQKAVCRELGRDFLSLWPVPLIFHLSWKCPLTCFVVNMQDLLFVRKQQSGMWTLAVKFTHRKHKKRCSISAVYKICGRQPEFVQSCGTAFWLTSTLCHKKSMLTFPLYPRVHAKENVIGLLTTSWSRWITVDVQNEYIYSHMRTAIITSVFLEEKAGVLCLRLRENSRTLIADERKPYFSDTIQAWKYHSRNSFIVKLIYKESK